MRGIELQTNLDWFVNTWSSIGMTVLKLFCILGLSNKYIDVDGSQGLTVQEKEPQLWGGIRQARTHYRFTIPCVCVCFSNSVL